MDCLVEERFRANAHSLTRSPERIIPEELDRGHEFERRQGSTELHEVLPKIEPDHPKKPDSVIATKKTSRRIREIRTKKSLPSSESSQETHRKPLVSQNIKSEYEQAVEFLDKINDQNWSQLDPDTDRHSLCRP